MWATSRCSTRLRSAGRPAWWGLSSARSTISPPPPPRPTTPTMATEPAWSEPTRAARRQPGRAACTHLRFALSSASPARPAPATTPPQPPTAKVRRVVVVTGIYPNDGGSPEWNIANDPSNYNYLFANCPVEVVSVGIELGNTVFSGPPAGAIAVQNPVKRGYDLWGSSTREAWGQLGVLYAVRG